MQLDVLSLYQNIHISVMALHKPWIPRVQHPRRSRMSVFNSQNLVYFIALYDLSHPEDFKLGERNFFLLLCCDLANLPTVTKQIYCGMCWWTITTLIWSAWARRSQHPASFFRVDGCAWRWEVLPSGPNIHCYYLIEEALGWDSVSYYWSVLMSRKEIVFLWLCYYAISTTTTTVAQCKRSYDL